jgi:hypothetical protein
MDRQLALKLFEIQKLENELKRGIYPDELVSKQIASRHEVGPLIEALASTFSIDVENVQGANAYHVTNIGYRHLMSYLDFKRELEK